MVTSLKSDSNRHGDCCRKFSMCYPHDRCFLYYYGTLPNNEDRFDLREV